MTSFYLNSPVVWPFKTTTIPKQLMPSKNSYTRNAQGLVYVEQIDISALVNLGFYLYGSTADLKDFVSGLSGSGDATKYVNGNGGLSTPAGGGGGSSGMSLVAASSGAFSAATSVNMPVPASKLYFDVEINNLMFSANDKLAFAVSTNGGSTWLNDDTNFDSYSIVGRRQPGEGESTDVHSTNNLGLDKGDLKIAAPIGITASFRIYPGTSSLLFQMKGDLTVTEDVEVLPMIYAPIYMAVNPLAMVTPTPARVTNILWLPYGNGDTPPTAGITMSGNLFLYAPPAL